MKSKVILNMYICDYESPNWKDNVEILNSIEFPTSIPTSKGHHRGFICLLKRWIFYKRFGG
jgi:hypothetical protein